MYSRTRAEGDGDKAQGPSLSHRFTSRSVDTAAPGGEFDSGGAARHVIGSANCISPFSSGGAEIIQNSNERFNLFPPFNLRRVASPSGSLCESAGPNGRRGRPRGSLSRSSKSRGAGRFCGGARQQGGRYHTAVSAVPPPPTPPQTRSHPDVFVPNAAAGIETQEMQPVRRERWLPALELRPRFPCRLSVVTSYHPGPNAASGSFELPCVCVYTAPPYRSTARVRGEKALNWTSYGVWRCEPGGRTGHSGKRVAHSAQGDLVNKRAAADMATTQLLLADRRAHGRGLSINGLKPPSLPEKEGEKREDSRKPIPPRLLDVAGTGREGGRGRGRLAENPRGRGVDSRHGFPHLRTTRERGGERSLCAPPQRGGSRRLEETDPPSRSLH
ncbi:hypothetical protein AAFF_G00309510 [Aldrovandia affinis]|uniref:Uncharacterized protein n=1 Tax=Aldrovandia affinis TaxID=143900 RepID=A0AAD7WR90_9TELE|nr:hypothetical protein AAFF_G00309510 [Aldrovandia affinis]